MTELPDPTRFSHVTDWVFDLDNTLYPHHSNLFSQIDVKMTAYVRSSCAVARGTPQAAEGAYKPYGTTLTG